MTALLRTVGTGVWRGRAAGSCRPVGSVGRDCGVAQTSLNHAHTIYHTRHRTRPDGPSPIYNIYSRQPAESAETYAGSSELAEARRTARPEEREKSSSRRGPRAGEFLGVTYSYTGRFITLLFRLQEDCSINILTPSSFIAHYASRTRLVQSPQNPLNRRRGHHSCPRGPSRAPRRTATHRRAPRWRPAWPEARGMCSGRCAPR